MLLLFLAYYSLVFSTILLSETLFPTTGTSKGGAVYAALIAPIVLPAFALPKRLQDYILDPICAITWPLLWLLERTIQN